MTLVGLSGSFAVPGYLVKVDNSFPLCWTETLALFAQGVSVYKASSYLWLCKYRWILRLVWWTAVGIHVTNKTLFMCSLTLTCFFHNWRELVAGHGNDDENDQRPDDQSQRPQLRHKITIKHEQTVYEEFIMEHPVCKSTFIVWFVPPQSWQGSRYIEVK